MSDDIVTRLRHTAEHHADLWLEAIVTEAADEIQRLQKQAAMAHEILSSEPFAWLITGSKHEYLHWQELKPFIQNYWDEYGSYFKGRGAW